MATTTTESLRYATSLNMKDFDDAMQVAAAFAGGADVIATPYLRDCIHVPGEVESPAKLVAMLG